MRKTNNYFQKRMLCFSFISILLTCCFFGTAVGDELYVSPSYGPPGTSIEVSVNIKNDVEPDYWNEYYGLEYKFVFDVRPADIINPNLWGWDNPIGSATIDYNGDLSGYAVIPQNVEPGTYYLFAAYQRGPGDPYHVYWSTTFTVEESEYNYDTDGDGFDDDIDDFPYDPNEWYDYDGDGLGDNADPNPYEYNNQYDYDNQNSNEYNNTPGYEVALVVIALIFLIYCKRKKIN